MKILLLTLCSLRNTRFTEKTTENGGGVFPAIRNGIVAMDRHELDSDAEVQGASI